MKTNLTIRFWKLFKTKSIMFIDTFSIIFITQLNDMKIRFVNEYMMYDNNETIYAYNNLIQEFFSLWEDYEFIDVLKNDWMKILLKDNWQSKIIEKSKIYSLDTKNRKILDKTFDDFHKKDCFEWTNKTTFFSYSIFIIWKTINEIRKNRTIVDSKEPNDFIIFDAYSIFSQLKIINDLKNYTHISVLDANAFFISDECIQKIHIN